MGKRYRDKKLEFDNMVYGYLLRRLTEPVEMTDAYKSGAVDELGHPTGNRTDDEWAYTNLDRLVFTIRSRMGKELGNATTPYADVNYLSMMTRASDPKLYKEKYDGMVALVEQSSYLPEDTRSMDDIFVGDDDELTYDERVSRAMTVASYLMFCVKKNRLPTSVEYDDVILSETEATFNIRSIGSYDEITDYLKKSKIVDSRGLTNEGYVLAVRLAKWIVGFELCSDTEDTDNQAYNWRRLSSAG